MDTTFVFYAGIPLRVIVKVEMKEFGAFKFMFAGCFVSILSNSLVGVTSAGLEAVRDGLLESWAAHGQSENARKRRRQAVYLIDAMLVQREVNS